MEEYIKGETLESILVENGPIPRKEACNFAECICEALTFIHSKGIVHRDIKPSNVVISNGKAVLIDLSIARIFSKTGGDTEALGTPGFAAPEQFGIAQSGRETDIYALGVLLNIMLTGEHPTVKLPSGGLGRIIQKATSTKISKRYSTAAKMKRAIHIYT